jgi:hypothetical protein
MSPEYARTARLRKSLTILQSELSLEVKRLENFDCSQVAVNVLKLMQKNARFLTT